MSRQRRACIVALLGSGAIYCNCAVKFRRLDAGLSLPGTHTHIPSPRNNCWAPRLMIEANACVSMCVRARPDLHGHTRTLRELPFCPVPCGLVPFVVVVIVVVVRVAVDEVGAHLRQRVLQHVLHHHIRLAREARRQVSAVRARHLLCKGEQNNRRCESRASKTDTMGAQSQHTLTLAVDFSCLPA